MEKKISAKDEEVKELNVDNSQKQFEVDRMKAKISQLQLEITNISQEKTTLLAQLEESRRRYKQDVSVYSSKEVQLMEVTTKMETYRLEILMYFRFSIKIN
jgi:chromosome segregation ATPase